MMSETEATPAFLLAPRCGEKRNQRKLGASIAQQYMAVLHHLQPGRSFKMVQ